MVPLSVSHHRAGARSYADTEHAQCRAILELPTIHRQSTGGDSGWTHSSPQLVHFSTVITGAIGPFGDPIVTMATPLPADAYVSPPFEGAFSDPRNPANPGLFFGLTDDLSPLEGVEFIRMPLFLYSSELNTPEVDTVELHFTNQKSGRRIVDRSTARFISAAHCRRSLSSFLTVERTRTPTVAH